MAAWDCADQIYDRQEALGEADALDGHDPTEAFYGDWRQDVSVAAELRRALEPVKAIAAMFESAA